MVSEEEVGGLTMAIQTRPLEYADQSTFFGPNSSKPLAATTFLKKSKLESPVTVWGKAVTAVGRGQEMIATSKRGQRKAPVGQLP